MSNVRDLFSNTGTGGLGFSLRREEVSEYFVIDGEKRTITPPNDFENFGVESDENTERVWFECPKVVGDDIDLTTYNLYINFRNANGEADKYLVEDVESDGELIHFSWVLSRKLTKYKGTVHFVVCAIKTDKYGKIANEWNTTLCSGDVLEGLEVENPTVDESTSDIIDQLVNLAKKSVADVESARATALAELKSAPSLEHSTRFANALKATASGEVVRVDDVSPNEHYAKVRVHGKNLVGISMIDGESRSDKEIIQKDGNDIVFPAIDGNVYGFAVYNSLLNFEIGKTYTASVGSVSAYDSTSYGWRVRYADGTVAKPDNGLVSTFLVEKEVEAFVFRIGSPYQGNTESRVTNIQIEESDIPSEYEPWLDPTTVTVTRCGADETDNPQNFTPGADGMVDVTTVAPTMTLFTDTEGVTLEVEYNRDINALVGDISSALGEVIELQQSILEGGE